MNKNIEYRERIIRLIVAFILIGLYFGGLLSNTAKTIILVSAVGLALTSFAGFCPLYILFGKKINNPKKYGNR